MSADGLTVNGLALKLGAFAISDVSLAAARGEVLVLLGPNGAGKSVLLETVAGFHRPLRGRVEIGGRDVTREAPEARRVAYVFQNFALFPHLTVKENVAFGAHAGGGQGAARGRRDIARGGRGAERARRVGALIERFGLSALADRRPGALSGGEKQRVALARALATDPELFLFDEPFSALDALMRDSLRDELASFLREARLPALYVTHDHAEAQALADRVAIVDGGTIVQAGAASEVFAAPRNARVARLVGVENVVDGVVRANGAGLAIEVGTPPAFVAPLRGRPSPIGTKVALSLRAADLALGAPGGAAAPGDAAFDATVRDVAPQGPFVRLRCDAGFPLVAWATSAQLRELDIAPGARIGLSCPLAALHRLED
ncbi:MAG TPA: ABC transporter ATP-binding protein [Casimicrobiaceae bacterium]